ncbi:hypothetical protein Bca4012_047696 [Brassica carinata]
MVLSISLFRQKNSLSVSRKEHGESLPLTHESRLSSFPRRIRRRITKSQRSVRRLCRRSRRLSRFNRRLGVAQPLLVESTGLSRSRNDGFGVCVGGSRLDRHLRVSLALLHLSESDFASLLGEESRRLSRCLDGSPRRLSSTVAILYLSLHALPRRIKRDNGSANINLRLRWFGSRWCGSRDIKLRLRWFGSRWWG